MSWSYSGNPASGTRDELRFLLGDTNESEPMMQDEELDYLIDARSTNANVLKYEAFSHAATLFAREYKRSLGPQHEDPTERLKYFTSRAEQYRAKAVKSGISLPVYAHPKIFRIGMQNNPPWPPPTEV